MRDYSSDMKELGLPLQSRRTTDELQNICGSLASGNGFDILRICPVLGLRAISGTGSSERRCAGTCRQDGSSGSGRRSSRLSWEQCIRRNPRSILTAIWRPGNDSNSEAAQQASVTDLNRGTDPRALAGTRLVLGAINMGHPSGRLLKLIHPWRSMESCR
jgi:hypothetical protein